LAETARLKAGRHQGKVTAREDAAGFVIIEADPHRDGPRVACLGLPQRFLELRFSFTRDDDLSASIDDRLGILDDEIDTFLVNKPGDKREEGTARNCQSELTPDILGVLRSTSPIPSVEGPGQGSASPWVPTFIDAVQNAR
jgi:hypothetical protein